MAETHARPSIPLPTPTLASRIATLSDDRSGRLDREHMAALCRRVGAEPPQPDAKWCALEAGPWWLRWEQHTEASTWTFYRPIAEDWSPGAADTALDLVPKDWLANMPGVTLVATHVNLRRSRPATPILDSALEIASQINDGTAEVYTDFRLGADGFTRFDLIQPVADAAQAGRTVLRIFEIETYRMLALLAFPMAGEATGTLNRLEAEANDAALGVQNEGDIESDRALLHRLSLVAGEAQILTGRTNFRFAAAKAYYGIVLERIGQLREKSMGSRPNISAFMERRLAPAMRTCVAVTERLQTVSEHIARTSQMLNTRVQLATEITNAKLLSSMNRRALSQLRLQQTVEGLSVAAISYYVAGLLNLVFKAVESRGAPLDAAVATGVSVPFVVGAVWWILHRLRSRIMIQSSGDSQT